MIRQLPRVFALAAQRTGRQVIVSTHAEEILSDRGVDPSEVLLLQPTGYETEVVAGHTNKRLLSAVHAKLPLGKVVTALTKPKNIEQLSLPLARELR